MIYIIGAGGVGSWLCPSLCMLMGPENVTVIDGDKLEHKNLNRQLFDLDQVGQFKSEALAEKYLCSSTWNWYTPGCMAHEAHDWLIACVDNNAARLAVLEACDRCGCKAIFAANETTSAEAYIYLSAWKGSRLDPRVMYSEMVTDKANDPTRAAMGCTGPAQEQNRQLVSANFMAAALAQHLFVCWHLELEKVDNIPAMIPHLPHKLLATVSRIESFKTGEREVPATTGATILTLPTMEGLDHE